MCVRFPEFKIVAVTVTITKETKQIKNPYYSITFPYISYAILARESQGSAYETHTNKVQTKQNHSIRLIFFTRPFGDQTESAHPWLDLLHVLTVCYKNVICAFFESYLR